MPSSATEQPETQVSVGSETAFVLKVRRINPDTGEFDWIDRSFVSHEFTLSQLPMVHRPHCRVIRRMLIDFVEQE